MKEQILKLRSEGKTYRQIQEIMNCSRSTISYYCGDNQKEKSKKRGQNLKTTLKYKVYSKIDTFLARRNDVVKIKYKKRTPEIIDYYNKIINNPYCYLTGDFIDLNDGASYQLDHIIPTSKGGTNSIDNMGLCKREVNVMKSSLSVEELLLWCNKIIDFNKTKVD